MSTITRDPRDTPASVDLDERIALHLLTGWRFLWRSYGDVWNAHMAGVTDGVTIRILGTCGAVVAEYHVEPEEDGVPVQGPARPVPVHYPADTLPGRRYGTRRDGRGALPVPSVWYAPWSAVHALAASLRAPSGVV